MAKAYKYRYTIIPRSYLGLEQYGIDISLHDRERNMPNKGVLGIKVKIMLDWDPKGKQGPMTLPDLVTIHMPKDEEEYVRPALMAGH
ncbi:hypothetical protein IFM89_005874 [Coptis chinensis]|uniref:Uncharacterized protein n=1 Tax=Coptis chinensis TaxID=261450 RepID=A0A835HLP3_9MAGN|nr:hypothetical protein IFM89_005874 [Coptis chinensis]